MLENFSDIAQHITYNHDHAVNFGTIGLGLMLAFYAADRAYAAKKKAVRLWCSTQQIIEATQARVEFDTVVYDNAEFYSDDVSYVATIPENGLYYVQGTVAVMPMASGTVSIGAVNIESDTFVGGEMINVEAQNVYTFKISTTAYFEKGDRIVIGVNNETNGDLYTVSLEQVSPILTLTRVGSL